MTSRDLRWLEKENLQLNEDLRDLNTKLSQLIGRKGYENLLGHFKKQKVVFQDRPVPRQLKVLKVESENAGKSLVILEKERAAVLKLLYRVESPVTFSETVARVRSKKDDIKGLKTEIFALALENKKLGKILEKGGIRKGQVKKLMVQFNGVKGRNGETEREIERLKRLEEELGGKADRVEQEIEEMRKKMSEMGIGGYDGAKEQRLGEVKERLSRETERLEIWKKGADRREREKEKRQDAKERMVQQMENANQELKLRVERQQREIKLEKQRRRKVRESDPVYSQMVQERVRGEDTARALSGEGVSGVIAEVRETNETEETHAEHSTNHSSSSNPKPQASNNTNESDDEVGKLLRNGKTGDSENKHSKENLEASLEMTKSTQQFEESNGDTAKQRTSNQESDMGIGIEGLTKADDEGYDQGYKTPSLGVSRREAEKGTSSDISKHKNGNDDSQDLSQIGENDDLNNNHSGGVNSADEEENIGGSGDNIENNEQNEDKESLKQDSMASLMIDKEEVKEAKKSQDEFDDLMGDKKSGKEEPPVDNMKSANLSGVESPKDDFGFGANEKDDDFDFMD